MTNYENKQFILEYFEALSGKEKTEELCRTYMSDEELINHIFFFEKIFPKYELFADELYGEDDKVIVKARVTGIHKGDFQGFAPTNKKVIIPFIIIYTIQSGKISDYYMVSDQYSLMQQLEMVPA